MTFDAPCADCGKDTQPHTKEGRPLFKHFDMYIVTESVWQQAGMDGYASGFLCTPCLEVRLGRELIDDDYLATQGPATSKGLTLVTTRQRMEEYEEYRLRNAEDPR